MISSDNDGPEIGHGAPNLNRNYNASTGVDLSPKYLVNSSFWRVLFHLFAIIVSFIMYSKNWCFLQKIDSEEDTFPPDELSKFVDKTNYKVGSLIRALMLLHMLSGILNGAFVVITIQTPRIIDVTY